MNSLNIFSGMSSDNSKTIPNVDKYLKGLNFRPINNLGGGNGALSNILGNNCEITFPYIKDVYKLELFKAYDGSNIFQPGTVEITINGQSTGNIDITEGTTHEEIAFKLKSLSNCYQNTYDSSKTFAVEYNNGYVIVYQNPEYQTCSITQPTNITINIVRISGGAGGSTIKYSTPEGILTTTNTPYIPALLTLDTIVTIGSTYINEDIYLYTCSKINPNKTGQVWKLSYDDLTSSSTIKLLYNGYLNFSINYPIPPLATTGRYEIPTIQRIYWSDNNNPIRTINVSADNLMALSTNVIDLKSSVDMSVATLKEIIDGGATNNLKCSSTYQFAYRLTKNNNSVTNYSMLSNIVTVIPQDTADFISGQNNYCSLEGGSGTVDKQIKWEIQGIDLNYNNIECVIIIRDYPNTDAFEIYKFATVLINNSTETITFLNNIDDFIPISENEFLIENSNFTHCKTLEQKDNRLFLGNVKSSLNSYIDSFDTRTYRFNASTNQIRVKKYIDDAVATTYNITTNSDYANIDEEADNIPVLNLGLSTSDNALYNNNFKYKNNSTVIGGEGPNISYSFGNLLIRADMTPLNPTPPGSLGNVDEGTERDDITSTQTYKNGYRKAGAVTNVNGGFYPFFQNGSIDQRYDTNNSFQSIGLEYFSGNFRSYQLNEIYRFAIVFKSTNGSTSFSKYIGDIKFPNYMDLVDPNLLGQTDEGLTCSDFRSMYYVASGAYLNVPYIQFEVNIPEELANHISGYEIVRVQRKDDDKTILNTGLISQVATGASVESSNFFLPISNSAEPGGANALDPPTYSYGAPWVAGSGAYNLVSYHPFNSLVDKNINTVKASDRLVITEKYDNITYNSTIWPASTAGSLSSYEEYYNINKYYNNSGFIYGNNSYSTAQQTLNLLEGYYVGISEETPTLISSGGVYKNYNYLFDYASSGVYDSRAYAVGSPMVLLGLDASQTPMIWENYAGVVNSNSKLLGLFFKASNINNQYGGNTFIARSNNEYISCGAFNKINTSGISKIKVLGGDIFYGIQDTQKAIKNWGSYTPAAGPKKHSQTWFFPTQSVYNVDLRGGLHVNADLNTNDGNGASGNDDYEYVKSYSYENTLVKFYPKPFNFNDTSAYQARIIWTDVKINGETEDSWSNVPVNNFYDLDGNYGGINGLLTLKNNVYFVQETGIGILYINPTSIITDQNNLPLKLGNGSTLEKHFYYSVDIGSKHQWSISKSNSAITFCDARHKKIYIFDGQTINPISDTKANRGIINRLLHDNILIKDNPITGVGILTTYDYLNNEFLYTFLNHNNIEINNPSAGEYDEKYTIVYSDLLAEFTSFYSFTPYIYINNHNKLYSLNDYTSTNNSKIYMHNKGNYCEFYGTYYPSTLKFIINPNPIATKTFDNLSWYTESIDENKSYVSDILDYVSIDDDVNKLTDTFSKVRVYNEYQNTDWVNLDLTKRTGNLRRLEQSYNMQMPRNKVNYDTNNINSISIFQPEILTKTLFKDRLRDKYIIVDLHYDNVGNRFILHNVTSTFRLSDR